MFCNAIEDDLLLAKATKCEVVLFQNDRVLINAKNKNGQTGDFWTPRKNLKNFRYYAWYNGMRTEFEAAKRLAKLGTIVFNATGQDWKLAGDFDLPQIIKLINQLNPYAKYYENKPTNNRNR